MSFEAWKPDVLVFVPNNDVETCDYQVVFEYKSHPEVWPDMDTVFRNEIVDLAISQSVANRAIRDMIGA